MKKKDLTVRLIFKEMDKVIQSRKNINALTLKRDKRANISFIIAKPISGSGKRHGEIINLPSTRMKLADVSNNGEYNKAKQSIKEINNTDNFCLIRAIVIAIAYCEKHPDRHNMLSRPNNKRMLNKLNCIRNVKNIQDEPCGINELIKIEKCYKYYQIMLIDSTYKITNKPLYLNTTDKFSRYIYLLYIHEDQHYNVIESMASYLFKSYYCDLCKKGFDHPEEHNCISICKACLRMNCRMDFKIKCKNCELFIQNKSCLDLHDETKCKVCILNHDTVLIYAVIQTNGVPTVKKLLIFITNVIYVMKKNSKAKHLKDLYFLILSHI